MKLTFQQTDHLLSEHMPPVTRRIFWVLLASFFFFQFLVLLPYGNEITSRLLYLKASEAVFQGHVWQLLLYAIAPPLGSLVGSAISAAFTLLMLFFFGGMVEEPMGSRRYTWFLLLVLLGTGVAHLVASLVIAQATLSLAGFFVATLAMLMVIILWYPDLTVRFMFFIPMPMKFLGILTAALILLGMLGSMSAMGPPAGFVMSLPMLSGPILAYLLLRFPRVLNTCEDLWWHNPFRRGPKPVRRSNNKRMGMGHPGRHTDADDRYNDPHWRLDQ